jgi:hypothetical protein
MKELDRRVSVAPMMDWSDARELSRGISNLRQLKIACRSFVAASTRFFFVADVADMRTVKHRHEDRTISRQARHDAVRLYVALTVATDCNGARRFTPECSERIASNLDV